MIVNGDTLQVLPALRLESIDAIVTDPPYGLEFMGRAWDAPWKPSGFDGRTRDNAGQVDGAYARFLDRGPTKYRAGSAFQGWVEEWGSAAFDALKPGGYLVAFGGTRTHHRLWSGIEDAGFEIRDTLMWLYGSGFPKSLDVSKAIDAGLGAERAAVPLAGTTGDVYGDGINVGFQDRPRSEPVTLEAKEWDGWGTGLKPGWEPILLARKPLRQSVWRNVLEHGTGALNIDATRVEGIPWEAHRASGLAATKFFTDGEAKIIDKEPHEGGRWPANLILTHSPACEQVGERRVKTSMGTRGGRSEENGYGFGATGEPIGYADQDGRETVEAWACEPGCPIRLLDEQSGSSSSSGGRAAQVGLQGFRGQVKAVIDCQPGYGDVGGASRFFYTAKASTSERNAWGRLKERNAHPTVKPIDLMAWLVRLVTPTGGLVLDPFAGSGTTLVAARREGFRGLGIELDPESARIAQARIAAQWEVKLL